jgi:D-alanyl-D-alanine carboxypeptidase/D-alanyl-D-alanine-endopeptidase (penicillin-binding protein 4)
MKKKHFLLALFLIHHSLFIYSQATSKLTDEIEKLKSDKAMQHASWSVCVMSVQKDAVIAEYNSHVSLIPASTLKLMTTGAALSMLGSDFTFKTKIQYDGTFDSTSGILKGNLYIIGGGDPTIDSKYFKNKNDSINTTDKWALILKTRGIKIIEGAVIGDASLFEDNTIPSQWIWGDIGNYFGTGASGLSCHDNSYSIFLNSGSAGSNTTINKTEPFIEGLKLINKVTAAGKSDSAFIYGSPYTNYRTIEGSIPANKKNYEVEGSMPDPALFCAQALEKSLQNIGVKTNQKATTIRHLKEEGKYTSSAKNTLYTYYSPSLEKIVYWTNLKSINMYAEHLLKYIAYIKTGIGKEDNGIETIVKFWKERGVDASGWTMNDGCGLSRANVITTKTQVQVLRKMFLDKTFKAFYNSLPVAGKSGSLGNLCEGTIAENNLCAKSGYITGARGYTGYVKNKKGELLCFSVLANNYECTATEMKRKLEKILIAIAELE